MSALWVRRAAITLCACVLLAALATPAFAARAATGEPLFYPCTSCHPTGDPAQELPIDFSGHRVVLDGHAALGVDSEACLACHDDPARDPGMLKLADGTLVEMTGDVSRVCFPCHSAIYREFEDGIHGAGKQKCSSAGCHDPHTPGFIFAGGVLPFTGSGFQFPVLSEIATFTPMAGPPVEAEYHDPEYLRVLTLLGVALAGGLAIALIRGGSDR